MVYKIRIRCTSMNELSFKGKCIGIGKCNSLLRQFMNELDVSYVDKIVLIHRRPAYTDRNNKKKRGFTRKSLEFILTDDIDKETFLYFIAFMKESGFASDTDTEIQLIDMDTNDVCYSYHFTSLSLTKTKKKINTPVKYSYSTQILK